MNPENIAETGAGAWLWASGSHVCMGASPALVPNPTKTNRNPTRSVAGSRREADARSVVHNIPSEPDRCNGLADAATNSVPMKANAIPTEQSMRYFHMASSDARERCSGIKRAVTKVVASIPTHINPRLFATSASDIVAREPSQSEENRRAVNRSNLATRISSPKYSQASSVQSRKTPSSAARCNAERASRNSQPRAANRGAPRNTDATTTEARDA